MAHLSPQKTLSVPHKGTLCRGVESEPQGIFGENKGAGYQLKAYSLLRGPGQEHSFVPVVV